MSQHTNVFRRHSPDTAYRNLLTESLDSFLPLPCAAPRTDAISIGRRCLTAAVEVSCRHKTERDPQSPDRPATPPPREAPWQHQHQRRLQPGGPQRQPPSVDSFGAGERSGGGTHGGSPDPRHCSAPQATRRPIRGWSIGTTAQRFPGRTADPMWRWRDYAGAFGVGGLRASADWTRAD